MSTARRHVAGFTLLEVLVAVTITAAATAIAAGTFWTIIRAWRQGTDVIDGLRRGDFVVEQVAVALRSAAFFKTSPSTYGFRFENGGIDRDELSWVTSSGAFVPRDSLLSESLFRIQLSIEPGLDGEPALAARVWSVFSDQDSDSVEPMIISSEIQGLDCRIGLYNKELETWEWTDRWAGKQTNSLPPRLDLTFRLRPTEYGVEPPVLRRIVRVPLGRAEAPVGLPAGEASGDEPDT